MKEMLLRPLYTMTHPFKGFDELKWGKKGSVRMSAAIVFLWFASVVAGRFLTGFLYNNNRPQDFNVFIDFARTFGIFILWVAANWCVCTLMEGSGTVREILISSADSLLPYILATIVQIALTNMLSKEEAVFLNMFVTVCLLWSIFDLYVAMQVIHEYSGGQSVKGMLLTVAAMAVMVFLILLFATLFQQLYVFLSTVVFELGMRL